MITKQMTKDIKKKELDSEQQKSHYQNNVIGLMREILRGIKLDEIVLPDDFTGQKHLDFCRFCHQTYHSEYFPIIVRALYFPNIFYAGAQAENYDIVTFNRATGNGVKLVEEFFQKYANIFDTKYSGQEDSFDPGRSFEPVK